jgi:hypothetical protein
LTLLGTSGSTTSGGEFGNGSGVRAKWDSKRYEGMRVSSLEARTIDPI